MTSNLKAILPKPSGSEINKYVTAAQKGDYESVAEFLAKYSGAIDQKDHNGWTPLLSAAWWGQKEIVALLLARGAMVDKEDAIRCTALMYAAMNGHKDIVEALLERGASPEKRNKVGKTALMLAQNADISALLENGPEIRKAWILAAEIADFSPALKRDIPALRPLKLPPPHVMKK